MQIWALDDGTDFCEWFPTEADALAYARDMVATIGGDEMRPTCVELTSAEVLCAMVNDILRRVGRLW